MMSANQAWQAVLGQLQIEMAKATFDTWARDTNFISFEDGLFIVGVQNAYARDWLDSRLSSTVVRILTGVMNRSVEVKFIVNIEKNTNIEEESEATTAIPVETSHLEINPNKNSLNPRYTFDNFIVGSSNRLAQAASLAVSENPANAYNPLFLYGDVGLGKTHLLHAIGNECSQKGLSVLYISSEEFTNDLISAIRSQKTQAFREKYRRLDVLLIDDIQFIAGKESTQEEFFHTFNKLHGQNKQIILTSDRSPKAISTLEKRLRSRFEWGLIADIQAPEIETRLAILQSKAIHQGQEVPKQILETIAQRMHSNVRELEGALNRIVAYADLRGIPLTEDLIDTALVDLMPKRRQVKPDQILDLVANKYNISVDQILDRNRSRQIALPRQIAMYLLREEAHISLPQIGEFLGGRDHTTVMYGCKKIAGLIDQDDHLRRQVVDIRDNLYGPELIS